jgi:hypothetical protein
VVQTASCFFSPNNSLRNYPPDHCATIGASCPFQIGDGEVQGEIKGAPNLMPALPTQFVAKPTSCLIDCCVKLSASFASKSLAENNKKFLGPYRTSDTDPTEPIEESEWPPHKQLST